MATAKMQQIHLSQHEPGYELVPVPGRSQLYYQEEHDRQQAYLLSRCAASLWHHDSYTALCPRPILVAKHHLQRMEDIHCALTAAITDIVQRWWHDEDADLPRRMPLQPEEEDHLRWLECQVSMGNLPPFTDRLGSWRPDFLVHDYRIHDYGGDVLEENFSITEINARFSFNGFMHEIYGQQALDQTFGTHISHLVSATSAQKILDGLFDLFDHTKPLHLLKDEEAGIDIHMFIDAVWHRLGMKPRLISPKQLRLVPDPQSPTGYSLCCIRDPTCNSPSRQSSNLGPILLSQKGEQVERIFQVGLELHQRELAAMVPEMLREVSLRCFNDLRTILLVHDKRMLGIIKQELPRLVARSVLTASQASVLEKGIIDTYLPGSEEIRRLSKDCQANPKLKDEYILKPIRGGKGAGIVFGDDISEQEWTETLARLSDQPQSASVGTQEPGQFKTDHLVMYVVQKRIIPRSYDMVLQPTGDVKRYPLVGTYHVINGELLGLGTWRTSGSRIVAISGGGSAICSMIKKA